MSERITPEKAEDVADRLHLERDGFDDPNMDNPVYAAMTEAEFLLRVLVAQMKADATRIVSLEAALVAAERYKADEKRVSMNLHAALGRVESQMGQRIDSLEAERERLRSAVDEARKALYANVECDCRETLTFDCWKCNLMRELNEVMGQTPPPAATAPPADR